MEAQQPMDWNKLIRRLLVLVVLWGTTLLGPETVFGVIDLYGVAFFITLILLFVWSFEKKWWDGFKLEIRNLVRHREDGGVNSVTAGMFLLGAFLYLLTTLVWIVSVFMQFLIDPNWYQFAERTGYVLMGARPVQMGVGYISSNVRDLYTRKRRSGGEIYSQDYEEATPEETNDLLEFTDPQPKPAKPAKAAAVTPKTSPEKFVAQFWPAAKKTQTDTGLSAIFTIAQGACESRWNLSPIGYNIMGITANEKYKGKKVLRATKEEHDSPNVKYPKIHSITGDDKKKKYRYEVERYFRVYNSYEECFLDRIKVLRQACYSHAWPFRSDPYKYLAQLQAPGKTHYATSSDYVKVLTSFIKQVEKIVAKLGLH